MIWPVIIVAASNTIYNIPSKSVSGEINIYASVIVTYLAALILTALLCRISGGFKSFSAELAKVNRASILLAFGVVGIEVGFLFLYRNGWPVGTGHITTSALLAIVLLAVGAVFFKESISFRQTAGIEVCIGGLALITL